MNFTNARVYTTLVGRFRRRDGQWVGVAVEVEMRFMDLRFWNVPGEPNVVLVESSPAVAQVGGHEYVDDDGDDDVPTTQPDNPQPDPLVVREAEIAGQRAGLAAAAEAAADRAMAEAETQPADVRNVRQRFS